VGTLQHATNDAVAKMDHVEVDEQPDFTSTELQVGEELCLVNRKDGFNGFQFDDHLLLDPQVDPVPGIEPAAAIDQRQWMLQFDPKPFQRQFLVQAESIGAFEQPRAKRRVNLDRTTQDPARHLIVTTASAVSFVSPVVSSHELL
jgi:hypothetical protein